MEKLSVSKEFVLAAHKAACGTWKSKIENEFPDLFKQKYEVGKWYKYDGEIFRIASQSSNLFNIDNTNRVISFFAIGSTTDRGCLPVNKEEIEKHLIALAEKKGFKHGVKINSLVHNREMTINKTGYSIEYIDGVLDKLHFGVSQEDSCLCCVVYEKGVWATIIEEPKTYTFIRHNEYGDTTISFKCTSEKEARDKLRNIVGYDHQYYKLKSTN